MANSALVSVFCIALFLGLFMTTSEACASFHFGCDPQDRNAPFLCAIEAIKRGIPADRGCHCKPKGTCVCNCHD